MTEPTPGSYDIRYGILYSGTIFNECGPESSGPAGWEPHLIQERYTAGQRYIKKLNEKNGFYDKLEKSIIECGIRNPIIISSGWVPTRKLIRLPIEMRNDHDKILVCHGLGGSRLWVAQKYKMMIPCIINDFTGRYNEYQLLKTEQDIFDKFIDKPKTIKITEYGVCIGSVPQIHIEEN